MALGDYVGKALGMPHGGQADQGWLSNPACWRCRVQAGLGSLDMVWIECSRLVMITHLNREWLGLLIMIWMQVA